MGRSNKIIKNEKYSLYLITSFVFGLGYKIVLFRLNLRISFVKSPFLFYFLELGLFYLIDRIAYEAAYKLVDEFGPKDSGDIMSAARSFLHWWGRLIVTIALIVFVDLLFFIVEVTNGFSDWVLSLFS